MDMIHDEMENFPAELPDDLKKRTILIKGAGEKASAVACILYRAGMKRIVMTDLPVPCSERRGVCFSEALIDLKKDVQGIVAQRTEFSINKVANLWEEGKISVIADPELKILKKVTPDILIDGVMAKRNNGTTLHCAPLVIALGLGFVSNKDCDFVVETNPASPNLGKVISEGAAEENTKLPTSVMGWSRERLLTAPAAGRLVSRKNIGDAVTKDETVGYVGSEDVKAQISGCLWGIMRDGIELKKGQKIGDIDPRGKKELCFQITPEARKIAEGVLLGIRMFPYKRF